MRIPQPEWTDVILPRTAQAIRSGRGVEIEIAYIRCIDGREPEAFELWDFSEDGIHEVHPFARVQIKDDLTKDTFYTHFFNARQIQIPFLGRRSANRSVQWLYATRAAPQAGSIFVLRLGMKTLLFAPGVPILLLFRRMFLLS